MSTNAQEQLVTDSGLTAEQIAERWAQLQQTQPRMRIRDAATELGVSEAQLLASQCGQNVTRLQADWGTLLTELEALGPMLALTRNEFIVHEKDGQYRNVEVFRSHANMGQVLDEGIDLRLFLNHWQFGFAVEKETQRGPSRSLQFFDASGTAVHKAFLRDGGSVEAYQALVQRYTSSDQSRVQVVQPKAASETEKPDSEVDIAGFHAAWQALKDTHDFIFVLRKFGLTRTQALRLAEPEMAWEVKTESFLQSLDMSAADGGKIMVFVSNPGCIQIHSGPVNKIKVMDGWLNVLDPGFNLHVKEKGLASAWVVRKPTNYGIVTGVEFYDTRGANLAILHGKRVEGNKQPGFWPDLCSRLPRV